MAIGTAEVSNGLATIVAAQSLEYLKNNTVFTRLVARDWDNEVAQKGQSVVITSRGTLTANDKTSGADVTKQSPSDGGITATLNQHKEATFLIEDVARALASPDYLMGYVEDAVSVIAESVDSYIAGLYTGFSQTIDATAGLTEIHFRQSNKLLTSAKAPRSRRYAVLKEDAEYELLGIEKATNRDYAESLGRAAADSFVGRFMGFDIFVDQGIVEVAGTPNQMKNLFFHRNAIVLVTRPLPLAPPGMGVTQVTMNEDDLGIRVTMGYDKDALGLQCTVDCLFGAAELRDSHGVVVSTAEQTF